MQQSLCQADVDNNGIVSRQEFEGPGLSLDSPKSNRLEAIAGRLEATAIRFEHD